MDNSTFSQSPASSFFDGNQKWFAHAAILLAAWCWLFHQKHDLPGLPSGEKEVEGIAFIKVEGGKFSQGCNTDRDGPCEYDDELPSRQVTIKNDFWLSKTEVTVAQFVRCVGVFPVRS